MATYFHGNSELIQENGDGLQTLILMNPAYVGYSDTQPPNLVFLNSNSAAAVSPPLESHLHYNPLINIGAAARDATRSTQGLSLSLSSNAQVNGFGSETDAGIIRVSKISNGVIQLSSKHLKAAQELLDEVVNVGKAAKINCTESVEEDINEQEKILHVSTGDGSAELTTSEKHEIQMKKAKLVSMLDEVEQRYKQYQQQVEMVTSWFEQIAGTASAKTYTALALKTISKQFRCLKDAILVQIRAATKNLGEEKIEAGSRLKYHVDNRIGQKRAIEQLGMRQHNAWRPQRGLPDRSVSVLRSWLFEHFLHPYPKDSDKVMLAKQTGLTRSQVSNWFINARVRLWKPMVEEMYAEEMKENKGNIHDQSEDKTESTSKSVSQASPTKRNMIGNNIIIIGSSETESTAQGISPKKPRNQKSIRSTNMELNRDIGFTLTGAPKNYFTEGYPTMEAQKLGSSNGVSLTLGLPHCETLSGAHQSFLSNQIVEADDFNTMNSPTSTSVYESIDVQNRKRFAGQLLPDFVT